MALQTRAHVAAAYHGIIASLLLLFGGALLGVGIWLLVSDEGGRLDLDFSGSSVWNLAFNFGIAAIVIGSFLLVTAVVSFIALSRRLVGKVFRFIYVLAALLIIAVLVFISAISLLIVTRRDSGPVKSFLRQAWINSVRDPSDVEGVCAVQDEFNCRGFDDDDCVGCPAGREATCDRDERDLCPTCGTDFRPPLTGCYDEIIDSARGIYLPVGIVAAVLAGLVLIDVFVVCFI